MTTLEQLVKEWRDAQRAIDAVPVRERQTNRAPLDRLVAAHIALAAYADQHLTN